jgi:hypothetical protein
MTYANKKAILKFGLIMIIGVVVASASMSAGVLADAPTESAYSDILNNTDGEGTSSNPHVVTTLDELQAVQGDLTAHYVLGNDIDASETETWNSGAGFKPIGNYPDRFSGIFDGKGYSVDGLYINRPNTDEIGLFSRVNSADIKNIGVTNLDIQGADSVGGLVADNDNGSNITNSFSSGNVSGDTDVGGLVGANIDYSYINNSYSLSSVTGTTEVGGLVGYNIDSGYITKSYSTGVVSGDNAVGGLVGEIYSSTVIDSYWDSETSTQSTSAGSAIGLTTAEITGSAAPTNMVGFDFSSPIWHTVLASDADSSADSYPILDSVDRQAQLVSADVYESTSNTDDSNTDDSTTDDSTEEEEAVIVSESSSEESGGMSTLVSASVVAFFGIFIMVVLLFGKD